MEISAGRSTEPPCRGVKKVSADVGTWHVTNRCCVGKNLGKERGIFSGLFGIIEVRPSAGVCVDGALVIQAWGGWGGVEEEEGRRERGFGP